MIGAQASRIVLKICCKSFLVYLEIEGVVLGITTMEKYAPRGPAGRLNNSSPHLGDKKESERVTKRRFLRRQLRPWTEVILELISSKILFQIGLLSRWVWKN